MQIKVLSILKLVSFESLAENDFSERGRQAEATQQRKTTKCVCNIVFHFVSAQLSVQSLVVPLRLSNKVADNIFNT